jgi:hypothetical protein
MLIARQRARRCLANVVSTQSLVERNEPKGNLDGFLAPLHDSEQNEGRATGSTDQAGKTL